MLNKIKNISLVVSLFVSGFVFFLLIFFHPSKGIQYGDFGLMNIQVQDIIQSGYSTFALNYKGESIDPEHKFYPYTKPFIGKVNGKYYIDFPPYFPLVNAPFVQFLGVNGLYLLNYVSLLLTLFLLYKLGKLYELDNSLIHLSIILYSFGMTSTMYNLVFHEYPLGIFWITLSFYFISNYYKKQNLSSLVLFGFFGAISLFFRLEMIFVIIASGLSLVFIQKKDFLKILIYSLCGFIFPFLLLLYLNYYIHGHPLGLRYLLTLTDNSTPSLLGRIAIIQDMLFSNTRGIFHQSPFILILAAAILFGKKFMNKERFLLILILIGFTLILLTSPNHGDHRAPRYLFGIYPILSLLSVICYQFLTTQIKSNEEFLKVSPKTKSILLTSLFTILILLSFHSTFQNYRWMKRAALGVAEFNQQLSKLAENNPIIFRDYAQPLNSQNLYLNQMMFVVENMDDLKTLLQKLKSTNVPKVIISQAFPSGIETGSRDNIVQNYTKSLTLTQQGDKFYFPNEEMYAIFEWIDLGKNQSLLVLNIFLY